MRQITEVTTPAMMVVAVFLALDMIGRALKRPSDGTDGRRSGNRCSQQYIETSRLLGREKHRRFF